MSTVAGIPVAVLVEGSVTRCIGSQSLRINAAWCQRPKDHLRQGRAGHDTRWQEKIMRWHEMTSNQIKSNDIKSNQIKSNQMTSNQMTSNQMTWHGSQRERVHHRSLLNDWKTRRAKDGWWYKNVYSATCSEPQNTQAVHVRHFWVRVTLPASDQLAHPSVQLDKQTNKHLPHRWDSESDGTATNQSAGVDR